MNPEDIGKFLENYTFETLMEQALDQVPADIDIREGSIIYDALAPACYRLSDFYMHLKNVMLDAFALTAIGEYLDLRVGERGLTRYPATKAVRRGHFTGEAGQPFEVPIGSRFATVESDSVFYTVTAKLSSPGYFELTAESEGSAGNSYAGQILPIETIPGLGVSNIDEIITPARNTETDDELRERYFDFLRKTSFGGNWQDYRETTLGLTGVGAVQVYPIWNGGGTVKVSILDSDYNLASPTFLNTVKDILDPVVGAGKGYGLAPIGHQVTVVTPTKKTINVSLHIDTLIGYTKETVTPLIKAAVEAYFLSLRQAWQDSDDLHNYGQTVYRSQIIAAILKVEGLANVANVLLNGSEADIPLIMTGEVQEAAFMGTVTLT